MVLLSAELMVDCFCVCVSWCERSVLLSIFSQTQNTQQIGNPKHFFDGFKNHFFFSPKEARYYFLSQRTLLKMSLNEKKRRRPSSSILNLAFGTVGFFYFTLSSSSPYAEAKETQKHHRSRAMMSFTVLGTPRSAAHRRRHHHHLPRL